MLMYREDYATSTGGRMITVNGIADLSKALKELGTKDSKAAVRKGTRAGQKPIQSRAKDYGPKASGALRKGVKVRAIKPYKNEVGCKTVLQIQPKGGKQPTRALGPSYGLWQNQGWTPKARRKDGTLATGNPVMGDHFMDDAWKAAGRGGCQIAANIIKSEIEKKRAK